MIILRTFSSPSRLKVSEADLEKAKTLGVIQHRPDNGKWGIISIKNKLWWSASYDTKEKAEAALKAYQVNKKH